MKNHEFIIDEWQDRDYYCEALVIYNVWAGCPGDDLTPPDAASIEVVDAIYRIYRKSKLASATFTAGAHTIDIPMSDSHFEFLDMDSIRDNIYDDLFPHS